MQQQGWHRADIIAAVRKKGSNLSRLGREHGYADSTLRNALIKPRTPSNRLIARFLDVPLHELWPQWFDRAGRLRPQRARRTVRASSPNRTAA